MLESTFLHTAKGRCTIIDDYRIWGDRKPIIIQNTKTGEEETFKNLKDAYDNAMIDGKRLGQIIASADESIFELPDIRQMKL